MPEHWFERRAWVLVMLMPIFFIVEAVRGLLLQVPPDEFFVEPMTGQTWEQLRASQPGVATYIQAVSTWHYMAMLLLAGFLVTLAFTAYRHGRRWAWYLVWAFLLGSLLTGLIRLVRYDVNTFVFGTPFLIILLLALLLPIRRFFPGKNGLAKRGPDAVPGRP